MLNYRELWIVGALALASFACALAYARLWRRLRPGRVPAGYGVLLPLAPIVVLAAVGVSLSDLAPYFVIAAGTAVYWFDDANGLPVRLRFVIQFLTGLLVAWLILAPGSTWPLAATAAACVAAGVLNMLLANVTNFYDGADLNLGVFILLTAAAVDVFCGRDVRLGALALGLAAFTAPFMILNSRPRTIELGDSGAFAFACVLTLIATGFVRSGGADTRLLAPAALPILDVLFVLALRLKNGEDLLSRNYHHLYQKLQAAGRNRLYLLPQVLNAVATLLVASLLLALGAGPVAVVVAMGGVTAVCYWLCRHRLLPAVQA